MKLSLSIHKNKILLLPALLALALGLWLAVPPVFCAGAVLCLAAAGLIRIRATGRHAWLLPALAACAASFMTVVLVQIANETIRLVPVWKLLLGAVCALLPTLLLYLPLSFLPKGGGKPAVLIASGLLLFLGVVNAFTYAARGTGMSPADFSAAGTALNVVGNYHLVFTPWMYLAVTVWAACALALAGAEIETPPRRRGFRLAALALLLVLTPTLRFALRPIRSLPWGREGAVNNGFLLNFTLELNELLVTKPAGYSPARVSETEAVYAAGQTAPERLPTVIVVMNEAFSDPRIYGELETDLPLMPVIDGLTENTVKGYALVSVYGGTTPNSEYEFLTGNSLAFFSAFDIPFMQRVSAPVYSLTRYLASLGYSSYATHPMPGSNWRREAVYPLLGFDEIAFDEAYTDYRARADYPFDDALFDKLLEALDARQGAESPDFLFAVTVQNHSPYTTGCSFDEPVHMLGYDSEAADEYLSCVHESDAAFGRFLEALRQRKEPVIVLMYGDHHPSETDAFIAHLHGGALNTLDEREKRYAVPYVLWANFDISEEGPACTSINYLSSLVLEKAGLPLPPWNRFLEQTRQIIPAINAYGYYSQTAGRFLTTEEAEGAEAAALQEYELLQYNAVFDKKNRSELFFPLG